MEQIIINSDWLKEVYEILPEEQKTNVDSGKMADLTNWIEKNRSFFGLDEIKKSSNYLAIKLIRQYHKISQDILDESLSVENADEQDLIDEKQIIYADYIPEQMSFADFPYLFPVKE